jgi:acetyl-CoA synthetase
VEEMRVYPPPEHFRKEARLADDSLYRRAAKKDRLQFWGEMADELHWFKKWNQVLDDSEAPYYRWFVGGKLNVSYNCLDRHVNSFRRNKAAIIFEAEDGSGVTLTYHQLYREVNHFAAVMQKMGVGRGDRVVIYMPMLPEAVMAMLACTRVGAVHSVVFSGFSAEALQKRITDLDASLLITVDGAFRRGKFIPLKDNAEQAICACQCIDKTLVVKRTGNAVNMQEGRDFWYHHMVKDVPSYCPPAEMDAEDPLFLLYSSGTTGAPKGILHTTGGYLTGVYTTYRYIFDYREEDVFWSTSDIGWITGQSYIVYGPLANGATIVLYEGTPDYPERDRFWQIIEKYGVTVFYTAPTAISTFMGWGTDWVKKRDLSSLRLLGSVGEPIKPEAWRWYYEQIGQKRCPIVDTWWQTETGMIMISPLPGVTTLKPGSATLPFPGVDLDIVDEKGNSLPAGEAGHLLINAPWPAMLRTLYNDRDRYEKAYWQQFPGRFNTGDGARRDADGYIWILGRLDDVINVSGHRLSTAEIEGALVDHALVTEAAVIGKAHAIKNQAVSAFVTLREGTGGTEELIKELKAHVSKKIGAIARPDDIFFTAELPKTRSGKIMRRLLRDIAEGRALGDTSTLLDAEVIAGIKRNYDGEEKANT